MSIDEINAYLCVGGPLDGERVLARGDVMRVLVPPPGGWFHATADTAALAARVAEYRLQLNDANEPVWTFNKIIER